MSLNILVVGAGVAGPALAVFLQSANPKHNITIVERYPLLRVAGQQIDLKSQGIPILKKMGLLETVKALCVAEKGADVVDTNGKLVAHFGINKAAEGGQRGLTSEYEIMRGDLVDVLYQRSLKQREEINKELGTEGTGSLTYEFGKTVTSLDNSDEGVDVNFSDGQKKRYDLVVGADGQGSRTRKMAFGQDGNDEAFNSIGVHTAYYSIPRVEGEGEMAQLFFSTGSRFVMTRNSDRPMTQVYLFIMKDSERFRTVHRETIEKQKEVWRESFKGAGWQTDRLLAGLSSCQDWYAHEIAQIKMKSWYTGRVVLLGDAGYSPSPFTGMGTTASLVGAYILAGELARNGKNVGAALENYNQIPRPPIDECQRMPSSVGKFFPTSKVGVWILNKSAWALAGLRLDERIARWFPAPKQETGWKIPEYPELNLEKA
ncbi:FAD/NAD(P)-binding domain-containing protein [Pleomassaria siparia CBS 279.74]|uniref:FAD/NAD(P)-binding domain-containing protein n=1 Tax=Pleomassaria siparia CBS 279.74 TaxID=1314801 RepID=A0A6G1K9U7_9PLEO|nr:FAD/NAD(P)-binding domain-containing protein [Pleomassaria siparia CBS 279.74]